MKTDRHAGGRDDRTSAGGDRCRSDGEPHDEPDRESGSTDCSGRASPVSRRAFMRTSGAAVGTAIVGSAPAAAGGSDSAITVSATDPYRETVAAGVEAVGPADGGASVRLRPAESDPASRLRDGDLDVHVSGRPTLAAAESDSESVAQYVTFSGRALIAHGETEWCDCLGPGELTDRWTADDPVETWSETDWRSVGGIEPVGESVGTGVPVVRGTRSFQYARGRGGVGYYSPSREALRIGPDASARTDDATPVVRLGYVHVDQSAVGDDHPVVRQVAGASARENVDESSYFAHPGVRTTA